MNVSHKDAQVALDLVENTQQRLRRAISEGYTSRLLMLWGGIWAAGFVSLHFLGGSRGGLIFTVLDVLGIGATAYFLHRAPHQTIMRSPQTRSLCRHIWGFWLILAVFAGIWGVLLQPSTGRQLGVFLCTLSMFAYVVMGLWIMSYFMVWIGFGVTALTLLGYYLVPGYFNLWMAVMGGGTLSFTGWYIYRHWR